MDTIQQFLEMQKQTLIEEVQAGEDRAAFIPSLDNEAVLDADAVRDAFLQCVQQQGYRRVRILYKGYDEVVVLMDRKGRASIWVERSLPQKKCRTAFRHFINMFVDGQQIRSIDGGLHVDHAYNKARVLNPQPFRDDTPIGAASKISAGYLRLFLIDERVNTSYGSGIESARSHKNKQQGGFRLCTWMMLLKLTGFLPPRTDDDHVSVITHLKGHFGGFGVSDAIIRAGVKTEFLQSENVHVVISQQGQTIRNNDELQIYDNTHKFSESRYARLIRDLFGWTIIDVRIDHRQELGLQIDGSECFYLLDHPYRIVFKPDVIGKSTENTVSASTCSDDHDDPMPYVNFIAAEDDDIRKNITRRDHWDEKVIDILQRAEPLTNHQLGNADRERAF